VRIWNLRHESGGDLVRVAATVTWEDCDLPAEEISYELDGVAPEEVFPSPETFAIRGTLAAFHKNEKRVLVEGPLCPRLRDGLRTALRMLKTWYFPDRSEPALEATGGFCALRPPAPRAALFLSGGSDSLSALRTNRMNFPPDHPSSFRVAIFVPSFGVRLEAFSSARVVDLRARQRRSIDEIARRTGLRVISAWLRSGELGEEEDFSGRCSHSSDLAAVGHLFSSWLSSASIAAGYDASYLVPWGSHPLLDPNYASSAVEIRVEEFGLTRAERVASVAQWNDILPHLLVCAEGPLEPGLLNCGRCEKCLRTMIALLLADGLRRPGPFPENDVDPARLEKLTLAPKIVTFWENFLPALRRRGRDDLARTVERLVAEGRRRADWIHDLGWKGRLRRLDRRILGGRLLQARRRLSSLQR
jgi:hypothetical protein